MRNVPPSGSTLVRGWLGFFLIAALAAPAAKGADTLALDQLLSAVVQIKTVIHPDGRTVGSLGRNREGSGIVIDDDGLILTIGYLMVEAQAAEVVTNEGRTVPANVVGYDHQSGIGLLRALVPLKVQPLGLGRSADLKEQEAVAIAAYGGVGRVAPAVVVAKREFAGSWEYLLDEAIFTSPPFRDWSGAALISHAGKLVGVGSLVVGDASGRGDGVAGNMFVPIDVLAPILADLIADGRISGPGRPWIGVTTQEAHGNLMIAAVTPGGPAQRSGLQRGDVIVGVGGAAPKDMADFYRKLYAQGAAGVTIGLDVQRNDQRQHFDVKSMNRLDHLRLKSTL